MGFRSKVFITVFLVLADIIATTVRPTWSHGGDFDQYLWVAGHLAIAFLEGVMIFAFFSGTIWFTAGLLGEMLFSVKFTLPLWFVRAFMVQMPWTYNEFASDTPETPWADPIYAVLFSVDIASAVLFWTSLMYTVSCMTDRKMYAPYHKEVCMELMAKYKAARTAQSVQQRTAATSSGGGGSQQLGGGGGGVFSPTELQPGGVSYGDPPGGAKKQTVTFAR